MKIELDPKERAFCANLCRAKSMTARSNSQTTKSDRQRVEYEQEARIAEELAIRFDDGEDLVLDQKAPIIPRPRIDLDQVDAPAKPAAPQPTEAEQRHRTHTRTPRSEGAKGQEAAGEA